MSLLELANQWKQEAEAFKRNPPKAQWVADPTARHELRFWDGNGWSQLVSDRGRQGEDPIDPGPDSPSWLDRFSNETLTTQREEALANRIGIRGDEYRAITKTMITSNAEAHPDKIAEHYASLVADEPDAGWVEHSSHARRYLYGERIEAGTAVALAWCKHCQAMTNAVPHDMPDPVNFRCSSCGHGVKHARVVPSAEAARVCADMTALTPKQRSKMPEDAWRARSLDEQREVYAKTLEECRDRFTKTIGEVREREQNFPMNVELT